MDTTEIVRCALQIEKSNADRSYETILTLLRDLDKMHVTSHQLETTEIVKVLYRLLRTCSNGSVKTTVKCLLSKWRRQYSKEGGGVKSSGERKDPQLSVSASLWKGSAVDEGLRDRKSPSVSMQTLDMGNGNVAADVSPSLAKGCVQGTISPAESTSASLQSSSVRSKCVQLLLAALCAQPSDQEHAAVLAANIELQIHHLHPTSQVRYKACVRSKVANLKNPKHGHLREGLLSGSLTPDVFAKMSAEKMACEELRQLRQKYLTRSLSERQLPQGTEGTKTQKIRCKRCGGTDCSLTQVSRGVLFLPAWVRRDGAGEDAMTFVTCSGCGQQWYHSSWICL